MSKWPKPSGYVTRLISAFDRFGNFIGEAEESEEESQHGGLGASAYVDDEEPDDNAGTNDQQLMALDGRHPL